MLIFVKEYEIDQSGGQEWEPQQVRYNEVFAKRDIIVYKRMHDMVIVLYFIFQMTECGHVKNSI